MAQLQGGQTGGGTTDPGTTPPVVTLPFNDIRGNRYANQIARASQLGLISGFPDGTFQPTSPVTREQAVSIVMQAAAQILPTSLIAARPQSVTSPPFPDVPASRWSALKILQAKSLGIVSGDFGTGNFRPDSNVSRAELMAMLYKLALVDADAGVGDLESPTPVPGQEQAASGIIPNVPNPPAFTDIGGHWAKALSGRWQLSVGWPLP
ncbi:MAG: S-layer homology domain-containing protein [Leptolyngbyaceae cyanobacterium SM2_5_2]|nr:S-layer homology domain-containing protein [Leptolyngbyaceae cyanobacterium SM2_5_2]